jgi:hypothetical protein
MCVQFKVPQNNKRLSVDWTRNVSENGAQVALWKIDLRSLWPAPGLYSFAMKAEMKFVKSFDAGPSSGDVGDRTG